MIIVLLGPPGAGKGTQAKRIEERYDVAHVSTGDLFRAAAAEEGELGRSVKGCLEAGQLVPDEVTSAMVAQRVEAEDCGRGFMLDGYPRTAGQAGALDGLLEKRGLRLDVVLYFDVSEEEAVKRLGGRRTCEECGANFHTVYMPPKDGGRCDRCGGSLMQRSDDRPDTVRERLKVYADRTRALVSEYERRGVLRRIDSNVPPDAVAASVAAVLDRVAAGSDG